MYKGGIQDKTETFPRYRDTTKIYIQGEKSYEKVFCFSLSIGDFIDGILIAGGCYSLALHRCPH